MVRLTVVRPRRRLHPQPLLNYVEHEAQEPQAGVFKARVSFLASVTWSGRKPCAIRTRRCSTVAEVALVAGWAAAHLCTRSRADAEGLLWRALKNDDAVRTTAI
jgi:hypothetical protein